MQRVVRSLCCYGLLLLSYAASHTIHAHQGQLTPSAAAFNTALKALDFDISLPDDAYFQSASTPYNLRFDYKPSAIAFPTNTQQVADIVRLAAKHDYKVVTRSGGHSYTASGLGGNNGKVVVDLQNLNTIRISSNAAPVAVIGPGAMLGELDVALSEKGRISTHGTCPTVGVGGHAAFGGYGFLSRKYGLFLDTIKEVELVLADGEIVKASRSSNADLFWALRGSAPSFGILTSITVQTFPMPPSTTTFMYKWSLSKHELSRAIGSFQTFAKSALAKPEFTAELYISPGDKELRKDCVSLALSGAFYDDHAKFNATIKPLLDRFKFAKAPTVQSVEEGNYMDSVNFFGKHSWGSHDTFYAKSLLTPQSSLISFKARSALAKYLVDNVGAETRWFVQIGMFGGPTSRVNKVPTSDTSFAHRKSLLMMQFYTSARNGKPPFPESGFALLDGMVDSIVKNESPGWDFGAYINYPDDRLKNWQQLYYGQNYPRLQQLKTKYDPQNVFSFPSSVWRAKPKRRAK